MRDGKKLISLLLALMMVLSIAPIASAATVDTAAPRLQASGEGMQAKVQEQGVEAIELTPSDSLDGLPANVGDIELVEGDMSEALGDEPVMVAGFSLEQIEYIEDIAKALETPVGAIGIELFPSNEMIDVIVWLQELPDALSDAYGQAAARSIAPYASKGAAARSQIRQTYDSTISFEYSTVFSGFAMTVSAAAARQIAKMPGVYAVTPDTLMYADEMTPLDAGGDYAGMSESREVLGINDIHNAEITGDGVVVGVLDTGIDYNHPDLAGVYRGGWNFILPEDDPGRPVGLEDDPMETTYAQWQASGDAELDDSGNEFYTSHGTHVSGTIAANPGEAPGTYRALGLAPDVDLYVARVLGPYGSGATTGIIAAVEDFSEGNGDRIKNGDETADTDYLPKADVINLSLGADNNSAYGADIFALNNAVIAGVNVAVSAGNNASKNGTMDDRATMTLGSPGTAYLPVTVAAAQYGGEVVKTYDMVTATAYPPILGAFEEPSEESLAEPSGESDGESPDASTDGSGDPSADAAGGTASFSLLIDGQNFTNVFGNDSITGDPAPVYVPDKGYEAYLAFSAAEAPFSDDGEAYLTQLQAIPDSSLAGKILVVNRGINFTDYLAQALRTGAGALIIVNSPAGGDSYARTIIGGMREATLPILSAYHSTRAKLIALSEGGNTVYLQLGAMTTTEQPKLPAYFSSIGPVNPITGLKPDIIAPGWSILSTAPAYITSLVHDAEDYIDAYQRMSGTSMSAPHMAGILALMVDKFPEATPAEIKARLMNTADPDLIEALAGGTPASVLEVGAGFVDPVRAILEDTGVYVTVQDDIPGLTADSVIPDQTLSSLSFGAVLGSGDSRMLPVTVHGAADFDVSVNYNNGTRYSNDATGNVELKWEAVDRAGDTFNVWVEVAEGAAEGYYEGRLVVTANDHDYTLPWLICVGEDQVPFDMLAFAERPIVSTSTDTAVRSAGGTNPVNSNATTLWLTWEGGAWPADSKGDQYLDLYLIDTETRNIAYYYGRAYLTGMENDGADVYPIPNIIGRMAYPVDENSHIGDKETIANGTYYLAPFASGSTSITYYTNLGVVFTDGTGDYEVELTVDPIYADPDPAVTTVEVTGNVYSPALAAAADAGFLWIPMYDFWLYNTYYEIDQSFNVLGFETADDMYLYYLYDQLYNVYLDEGDSPWVCDENGDFTITMPAPANKAGGAPFTNGLVGVEGFYSNHDGSIVEIGGKYYYSIYAIGANKSAAAAPVSLLPVSIPAIGGVTVPARTETPVSGITETDQYTGTVTWEPADDPFGSYTVYTATITLTPKTGYTFHGIPENYFTVAGATATNDADSGVITAVFPRTEPAPISIADPGLAAPVCYYVPGKTVNTAQYTGTVTWSPNDTMFKTRTVYTATITITPKDGYTLTGVPKNFFSVAGATSTTYAAGSNVITAVFPATGAYVPDPESGGGGGGGGGGSTGGTTTTPTTPVIPVTALPASVGALRNAAASAPAGTFNTAVEVRVTETNNADKLTKAIAKTFFSGSASKAGKLTILPLDISVYERNTENRVQPNAGFTVTLTLPIPQSMLANKESLVVGYVDGNGWFVTRPTEVVAVDGVSCVRFTTSHFSDYALIADVNANLSTISVPNTGSEASGLGMCLFAASLALFGAGVALNSKKRRDAK